MARANLLNTRTADFLELIGNGKSFRVPPYQRDYSWHDEQWDDLWQDLMELRQQPEERHYMGALVVEARSDREYGIIDGQQRMATLTLLVLAVIAELHALADAGVESDANRQRAQGLRYRFVGEKDPVSLTESSKLRLNETDDAFFQDYLIQLRQPQVLRSLPKSNRRLWECWQFFRTRLGETPELAGDGERLTRLIADTTARQLQFILITVDDELNAYTVFETLNARGLELSATDLLKNYLFSRVRVPSDRAALQRRWYRLIATVSQERFPEFLRYHLLCEEPKIRTQRLFKLVRARVREPGEVFALLDALERRGELFAALGDPEHEYWLDRPSCRPHIRELRLFGVRQMTPLLFAAWERFGGEGEPFARVLKLVSTIAFRHTIVCGLNTNLLEPVYHQAAKAVATGAASRLPELFQVLRAIYVDDEKFEQDFAQLAVTSSGQKRKLAKYVLAKLESERGAQVDPETDPGTIEHILPENPSAAWAEQFPEEHWTRYLYRLGNLTLLESAANRSAGNDTYAEKVARYHASRYELTRSLAKDFASGWSPAAVERRQREMAARAVHIWRVDYA